MPQKYPLPSTWRGRVVAHARGMCWGKVETTPNRSQFCDYIQTRNGGEKGEYWCMDFVCVVFHDVLQLASPLLQSGSCEQQRQRAIAKRALRTRSEFDAARAVDPLTVSAWVGLVIGKDDAGRNHAHHTFIVGDLGPDSSVIVTGPRGGWLTCEGNAADPTGAASSNGDGAYHGRERGHPADPGLYQFIDPLALSQA